jgi:hypothetical protein
MNAAELLTDLTKRGVVLEIEGHRLLVDAPRDVLSRSLREALVAHKTGLLDLLTVDYARREAALAFVNRSGARLVCPCCWPGCPTEARYAILVPAENDDLQFREALRVLKLADLPVVPRNEPLGFIRPTGQCQWAAMAPKARSTAQKTKSDASRGNAAEERAIPWLEWYADRLNWMFQEHGATGQPGHILAETVLARDGTQAKTRRCRSTDHALAGTRKRGF